MMLLPFRHHRTRNCRQDISKSGHQHIKGKKQLPHGAYFVFSRLHLLRIAVILLLSANADINIDQKWTGLDILFLVVRGMAAALARHSGLKDAGLAA